MIMNVTSANAADWPERDAFIKRPTDSFEISTDYETPHITWNRPSATGPVRLLAIAPS